MDKKLLIEYLNCRQIPLTGQEQMVTLHQRLCEAAPEFYLYLLADPFADLSHKREMLANLIRLPAAHTVTRQRIVEQLRVLPAEEALLVADVIRQRRINNRRAREIGLQLLIGHEQFPQLAAARRQRVTLLLKHLLGERTWSSVRRFLAQPSEVGEKFLQRELLHYAPNPAIARETLCFLAGVPFDPSDPTLAKRIAAREQLEHGEGLPRETLFGLRGIYHRDMPASRVRSLSASEARVECQDGPLTMLYREALHRGVKSENYSEELWRCTEQAVASLPLIEGRLAVVLDLSASMTSSGERAYHPAALALALVHLLQQRVTSVMLYQVGGSALASEELLPRPRGVTDLASALLEAARTQPQAILLITDGYENMRSGDAALVLQGMRLLGLAMPVYQVVPVYSRSERLQQRHLGDDFLLLPVLHEQGVREVLTRLFLDYTAEFISPVDAEQVQQLLLKR
ncbi:MAG: VWA domain-containing protein [Thermogemmatispora sp.]|uniref:vWA domain-containing protein n=1 Tax=Thermogemmatispora sp. TaxID=1968838 RepID=UPI00260D24B6|nr:vWA domain-containing protein [Thermogemmatispora sp.]MBX5455355.1 VWA domain-containing protein [Thermogemmatispora sp.]